MELLPFTTPTVATVILPPMVWKAIRDNPVKALQIIWGAATLSTRYYAKFLYYYWKRPALVAVCLTFGSLFLKNAPWRFWLSLYLNWTKLRPRLRSEQPRKTFTSLPTETVRPVSGHTHPIAAADRSTAVFFMERLAPLLGLQTYYVQRSRYDEIEKRAGSRDYYWTKDLQMEPTRFSPPNDSLLCMVDVDQYIDMPQFLSDNYKPVLIYTFQPTAVSRVMKNYSYTFDRDNEVQYTVTGGGTFKHPVWKYGTDHLVVYSYRADVCIRATAYFVDRRATSIDHELILLTPIGRWNGLSAIIYCLTLGGTQLSRLKVAHPIGFNRLVVKSQNGIQISTGRTGAYLSISVPITSDDAIAGIAATSKYDLTLPQVQSYVPGDKENAVPLLEYHRALQPVKADEVCPVPEGVRTYQYNPSTYDPAAKPSLTAFMSPLIHGSFAPARTKANEEECIRARVDSVKPPPLKMTKFLHKCMEEFVSLMIPKPHQLHPTDYDEVFDRQPRPSQRRLLWTSMGMLPKRIVSMFLKAESYANVKAPRPISIINPVDKREYSRFIYALEQVLKSQPWYAFGQTPQDIAKRVVQILLKADFATPTDYAKFDGHGSDLMRMFERMVLLRAFHPDHHSDLIDLHMSQYNLEAYGMFGTWYQTDFIRSSGSPETSLFNTMLNAFIAYVAKRMVRKGGINTSPVDAYDSLGIYGGDDGLTADIPAHVYVKAAKMMGQELTIETIQRGKFGIKFLARVYSDQVWFGNVTNCCDLPRQLVKIHTTVNLPPNVTPADKLKEKVRGYLLTDPHTPILSDFCRRVVDFTGEIKEDEKTEKMRTWLANFDKTKQYDNGPEQWMTDYCVGILPDFDHKRLALRLYEAKKIDDLLHLPMFMAPVIAESKYPVVVDGSVLPPSTIVKHDLEYLPIPPLEDPVRLPYCHPYLYRQLQKQRPGWSLSNRIPAKEDNRMLYDEVPDLTVLDMFEAGYHG